MNYMLQPIIIPRTPEEIAMSLNKLTENERYMVKGVIIGIQATHRETATDDQRKRERHSA